MGEGDADLCTYVRLDLLVSVVMTVQGLKIVLSAWNEVVADEERREIMKDSAMRGDALDALEVVWIVDEACADTMTDKDVSLFWSDVTAILGPKV